MDNGFFSLSPKSKHTASIITRFFLSPLPSQVVPAPFAGLIPGTVFLSNRMWYISPSLEGGMPLACPISPRAPVTGGDIGEFKLVACGQTPAPWFTPAEPAALLLQP
jgi:hypothetical protein